ncbi:MAG: hypothetical protein ACOX1V_03375 [Candidatus Iainarchaeum sp.]|jgi:uncharacterized membrane protein YiaA
MSMKKELRKSIKRTKEYHYQKDFTIIFILGIVLGIVGNIVATGLWEFFPILKEGLFWIAVVILVLLFPLTKLKLDNIADDIVAEKAIPFEFKSIKKSRNIKQAKK